MRTNHLIPVSVVSAALMLSLTPNLSAQSPNAKEVIGLTHGAVYLNRMSMDTRTCASRFCSVLNFEQRVPTFRNVDDFSKPTTWTRTSAGGTARDGRHGGPSARAMSQLTETGEKPPADRPNRERRYPSSQDRSNESSRQRDRENPEHLHKVVDRSFRRGTTQR